MPSWADVVAMAGALPEVVPAPLHLRQEGTERRRREGQRAARGVLAVCRSPGTTVVSNESSEVACPSRLIHFPSHSGGTSALRV